MYFQICFPPSLECFDPYITDCLSTSVEDLTLDDEKTINIYPVPAQDFVNIQVKISGAIQVRIINLYGTEVYQQTFYSNGNLSEKVFIGDLYEGMYLVNITTDQQNYTRKITIKR